MENNEANHNKFRKKLLFGLLVLIFIILATYFIITKINLTTPTSKTINQNEIKKELPENFNPKLITLTSYPLDQSPLFQELSENCLKDYESLKDNWDYNKHFTLDYQIEDEKSNIIIDSLKRTINKIDEKNIYSSQDVYTACNTTEQFKIFSAPENGTHIYIEKFHMSPNGQYNPGFDGLYSLNLADLTIKKLFAGNLLKQGSRSIKNYQILKDGKRVVKWDNNSIYLINLEQDSFRYLFVTDGNMGDWLVSKIELSMGYLFYYDIQLIDDKIEASIFSSQLDKNENRIREVNDQFFVISDNWHNDDTIEPKFINKIIIPIPD